MNNKINKIKYKRFIHCCWVYITFEMPWNVGKTPTRNFSVLRLALLRNCVASFLHTCGRKLCQSGCDGDLKTFFRELDIQLLVLAFQLLMKFQARRRISENPTNVASNYNLVGWGRDARCQMVQLNSASEVQSQLLRKWTWHKATLYQQNNLNGDVISSCFDNLSRTLLTTA